MNYGHIIWKLIKKYDIWEIIQQNAGVIETISKKDIIVAFVSPMLMVISTCALFI